MNSRHGDNAQEALASENVGAERRAAMLALLTIVGIILYIILDVIAQLLPPHYNPITQAESDLAVGPYGYVMTINFVLRGLLSLALLWALSLTGLKQALSRLGLALVGVWAVGALVLALFPTGLIHALVALLAFICGAIGELLLSSGFSNDERWRSLRLPGIAIAVLAIVDLFIVFGLVHIPLLLNDFGLYERLFIGLVLLWMLVVAVRIRSAGGEM